MGNDGPMVILDNLGDLAVDSSDFTFRAQHPSQPLARPQVPKRSTSEARSKLAGRALAGTKAIEKTSGTHEADVERWCGIVGAGSARECIWLEVVDTRGRGDKLCAMKHRQPGKRSGRVRTDSRPAPAGPGVGGWLLGICVLLVFLQPLAITVIPVVFYDEYRLPASESIFMFSASVAAWRNVIIALYGVVVGVFLWRGHPGAPRMVRTYLLVSLISAFVLLALPFLIPFHSHLRKPIRVEQAEWFLATLLVFGACYSYFTFSRRVKSIWLEDPAGDLGFLAGFVPRALAPRIAATAGVGLLGCGLSAAAFLTTPIDVFEASWEGDLRAVQHFLGNGEDVNSTLEDECIPLHLAGTKAVAELLLATNTRREESYFLTSKAFKNLPVLAAKLRRHSDPLSQHLWGRLSVRSREMLGDPRYGLDQIQPSLIDDLNQILHEGLSYDPGLFTNVSFSRATLGLKAQTLQGIERVHLSRLLLEDAFPGEVDKYHVEWRNSIRDTPLHLAAYNGRPEVALVLLGCGADVNSSNRLGMTSLDYALFGRAMHRRGKFDSVISLLVAKGGWANTQGDKLTRPQVSADGGRVAPSAPGGSPTGQRG